MADFNTSKVDGDTVGASEWNQLASIDNFISTSGQTPSTSNLNQTGIAAARYSSGGQFYTDSGIANAYVLSPVSPFKSPVSSGSGEGYFVGMTIRFRAGNANTGASTVNVNSAGVKNLKKEDGTTDLAAGDIPTNRDVKFRYNGTSFVQLIEAIFATTSTSGTTLLPSSITIANNATDANNDIDFSAGVFQFSDGSGQAVALALTKQLDATWAAGTNQGGLDTGSKATSTWYHCYAIYNPTTLASDFLFSTGATTPTTLPSGYTKYRRVGSVRTNGSGNILAFNQIGNKFLLQSIILDYTATPAATSKTDVTTTVPPGLLGIYSFLVTTYGSSIFSIRGFNPTATDATPDHTNSQFVIEAGGSGDKVSATAYLEIVTNSSSQISYRASVGTGGFFYIKTQGWIDNQI